MRRRCQVMQRALPRPTEINMAILRPKDLDTAMTDQQKVRMNMHKGTLSNLFAICMTFLQILCVHESQSSLTTAPLPHSMKSM